MTQQQLIDKIQEIMELASETAGLTKEDEDNLNWIVNICDRIITDHKIEVRLNERH